MKITYSDAVTNGAAAAVQVDAGQAVGDDGDRVIKKIFVGKPVAGASLIVFNSNNALGNATTNIAFKYTFPTFGAGTPAVDNFTFTLGENAGSQAAVDGMVLSGGGSFVTTSAMQVSVLWDLPEA